MFNPKNNKTGKWLITALIAFSLAGCATPKDPKDPFEPLNRQIFKFNTVVDKAVYRPVAKTYDFIVPQMVQKRVTSFFNNLNQIPTVANDVLQLNVYQTLADTSRFVVNSTFGIAGLFDPATKINLPEHHSDFGLTLARWGYKGSAYFVIPLIGPSTIRDAVGMPPNIYLSVWPYIDPAWISWSTFAVNHINQRAALLPTDKLVDQAFDPYVFVRDAYLQYRQGQINQIGVMDQLNANNNDTFVAAGPEGATAPSTTILNIQPRAVMGSKAALEAQTAKGATTGNQQTDTLKSDNDKSAAVTSNPTKKTTDSQFPKKQHKNKNTTHSKAQHKPQAHHTKKIYLKKIAKKHNSAKVSVLVLPIPEKL